ncbi:hypothetical protein [Ralstonia pseudosolanacearum]|uniref:hypothetical protein n=1 Tax=Ralstonia pseudosolanacearum TaxID=1310165 RepID=UPI003CF6878E
MNGFRAWPLILIFVALLSECSLSGYVTSKKREMTDIAAPEKLPPRAHGEVLVTWPVLVAQFDKTKPECKQLLDAAQKVNDSWISLAPVMSNTHDIVLIEFKTKARRADCLVLDKGEVY